MKVTSVELSEDEISDIMDRAPRACKYWATFQDLPIEKGLGYSVFHDEQDEIQLLTEHINRGVCLAMTKSQYVSSQVRSREDLRLIDIPAVDIIVQYGLFGKLVYG